MNTRGTLNLCDRLAAAAAGRELALLLAGLDLRSLSGEEAAALLMAQRRQAAHYQAGSLDTMIELGLRDEEAGPGERRKFPGEFAAEEPRALLHLTKAAADSEFWTGWALWDEFPAVMARFRVGSLDWSRARLFPEVLLNLTPAQMDVITGRVLPDAPGLTTGQLRARLQREAMAIDPTWRKRRYAEQVRNRRVEKCVNADGTADLSGRDMPLDEVVQAMANLTRLAKSAKRAGDPRRLDMIRADLYNGYLSGSYQQVADEDIIRDLLRHATAESNRHAHDSDGAPCGSDSEPQDPEQHPRDFEQESRAAEGDSPTVRESRAAGEGSWGGEGFGEAGASVRGDGRQSRSEKAENRDQDNASLGFGREDSDPASRRGRGVQTNSAGAESCRDGEPLPTRPMTAPRPAGVEIRIELSTLLGLDDHPGELPGTGPVSADVARKLVAQQTRGRWHYAFCDQNGYLIDTGVIHARPTGWLDFGTPVTDATVEIALTNDLFRTAPRILNGNSPQTSPAFELWAPVLAAIARAISSVVPVRMARGDHGCGMPESDGTVLGGPSFRRSGVRRGHRGRSSVAAA